MDTLAIADIRGILVRIAAIMAEKREELIRLDGAVGDGDLGLTMEKGFAAARQEAESSTDTDPGKLLVRAGMAIAKAAPSTMGTLMATGFMSGGKALQGAPSVGLAEMAAFFEAFVGGIMQRGKARPGEKTVVDVLHPASQALSEAAAAGAGLQEGFRRFQAAAATGLERSREMLAQHGRVAYYQEQSRGKEDPGAVAGSYLVQGFCDYVAGPQA